MLLRPLEESECRALLESQRLCVLSLVDGKEPYAVPVFYAIDGSSIILGLSEGRKTRVLEANARVCLTVMEVRADGFWQSAQVTGNAEIVESDGERERAIAALIAHNRRLNPSARGQSPPRAAPGKIVRVPFDTLTGRAREIPASHPSPPADQPKG